MPGKKKNVKMMRGGGMTKMRGGGMTPAMKRGGGMAKKKNAKKKTKKKAKKKYKLEVVKLTTSLNLHLKLSSRDLFYLVNFLQ